MKQLGPIAEINIKVKLPQAFLDYINEIEKEDLGKYCSEEVIVSMIAHLDGGEDIVLKKYTIPRGVAFLYNEIMHTYAGWDYKK
jgi:hypothetical protein